MLKRAAAILAPTAMLTALATPLTSTTHFKLSTKMETKNVRSAASRAASEIEPADFESGEYVLVQDCEVCCRPWTVRVQRDPNGAITVSAERD